jgi:glutaredoxin-related protein
MRWGAVTSPSLFVDEFNRHNIDWFIVDITSSTPANTTMMK